MTTETEHVEVLAPEPLAAVSWEAGGVPRPRPGAHAVWLDDAQRILREAVEAETARTDDLQARLDALVDVAYAAVRAWTPALLEQHLEEHYPRGQQ